MTGIERVISPLKVVEHVLNMVDAWIAKQNAPMTRPEAIRAMLDAVLVIVAKDPGEKPAKKAKLR
jgi:hypothetical protein